MKGKITEKRIYELLGVNLFRKYILGGYQAILNGFFFITGLTKLFGFKDIYKMQDLSIEGLKNYKKWSKIYAIEHIFSFVFASIMIRDNIPSLIYLGLFIMFTDVYAIMTQRYHHIRINEILEKYNNRKQMKSDINEKKLFNENTIDLNLMESEEISKTVEYVTTNLSITEQRKQLELLRKKIITSHQKQPIEAIGKTRELIRDNMT